MTRDDPDFGVITFEQGLWCSIPPASPYPFMLTVDAGGDGPSEHQRQFLRKLMSDFSSHQSKGLAFVDLHRSDAGELSVYLLEIPNDGELSCGNFTIEYADVQAETIHRAEFVEFEPTRYGADD